MAPLPTNGLAHFLHPAHKLTQLVDNTPYLCDGCKIPGNQTRFSCINCSFDLHEYCAKGPTRLTSTTTHPHPMSLVVHKPLPDQTVSCQSCHNAIEGLAYACKACNFWVHPLCVSDNSGQSHEHNVRSASTGGQQGRASAGAQRVGEAIAVGLVTNAIYDEIKDDDNKVPLVGSNASGSSGGDKEGGGFFGAIMDGFSSFFESSSA